MSRAIILAAGLSSRFKSVTKYFHKSLLRIQGKSIIERQIDYLVEHGVDEIYIVVGYNNHLFSFLKEKYGSTIRLVFNENYHIHNNCYSLYMVKDKLADSFIIEADLFLTQNVFNQINKNSTSYGVKRNLSKKKEWKVVSDELQRIRSVEVTYSLGHYVSGGISYIHSKDATILEQELNQLASTKAFAQKYWDDILINNLKNINVFMSRLRSNSVYEIDDSEDLFSLIYIIARERNNEPG